MLTAPLIDVSARCITRKNAAAPRKKSKTVQGCVAGVPQIGSALVIYRRDSTGRLVTSPIVRVLVDADGVTMYVETRNSVYRIAIKSRPR